jgi:hypothetical protein
MIASSTLIETKHARTHAPYWINDNTVALETTIVGWMDPYQGAKQQQQQKTIQ